MILEGIVTTVNHDASVNISPMGPDVDEFFTRAQPVLDFLFLTDPHIDKDGDLSSTGRFGVGLLETAAAIAGFTGDDNDFE